MGTNSSKLDSSEEEEDVADDEDLVESSDDLMGPSTVESFDSGVSFKSDQSKGRLIHFKVRVSLGGLNFSSSEEENDVADDEDWVESSDDLMVKRRTESFDSGVSLKRNGQRSLPSRSDFSSSEEKYTVKDLGFSDDLMVKRRTESFDSGVSFKSNRYHSLPILLNFSSSEKKHVVADEEDLVKSSDDKMVKRSMESFDSGVSFKSDQSKGGLINFKDSFSPIGSHSSSSEKEHDVADDEGFFESSDDLGTR